MATSMELGSGTVAAGGSLGMLIPPSVVFIVYGIMTEQSIGRCSWPALCLACWCRACSA
jgi:TRAP-type C4-dicarboxylate transport system permease large subunit